MNCNNKSYIYDNDLNSTDTCLALKPSEKLTNFLNQFTWFSSDQKKKSDNIRNCNYYEIQTLNKRYNKYSLPLYYINVCSFSENKEDLEYLLDST